MRIFGILFSQSPTLPEDFTTVALAQQPDVRLPSDLSLAIVASESHY